MKLIGYDGNQRLNTINGGVQANVNEMAYGGNTQGMDNLTKAIGDLGNNAYNTKAKGNDRCCKCNE